MAILTQSLSLTVPSPATISDAVLQGNYSDPSGLTGTITLKCKGNSHLRHEISLNGSQQTLLVTQGIGRAVQDGNSQNLPFWVTKYLRPDYIPAFSRLSGFIPNTQIVYVGLETLPDRSLHHIRLSSIPTDNTPPAVEDKMSEYHVFIDSHSGLLFKTLSFAFSTEILCLEGVANTLDDMWPG